MLSAHERRQLHDIELRSHAEDPQFARTMTGTSQRRRHMPVISAVLASALLVLGVATAGFPLVFFGFVTAMVAGCLRRGHHNDE